MRTTICMLTLGAALLQTRGVSAASGINCVGLEVTAPGVTAAGNALPQFSATKEVDLTVRLHVSQNIKGDHVVQLRYFTPQQHLYQAMDVPLVDPGAAAGSRKLTGYPFPVKEKRPTLANARSGALAVEAGFPVGGTAIVSRGIYGTWTVNAFLDASPQPFCQPAAFTIVP